eukprot:gene49554-27521_t
MGGPIMLAAQAALPEALPAAPEGVRKGSLMMGPPIARFGSAHAASPPHTHVPPGSGSPRRAAAAHADRDDSAAREAGPTRHAGPDQRGDAMGD